MYYQYLAQGLTDLGDKGTMIKNTMCAVLIGAFWATSASANFCDRYDCVDFADSIISQDSRSWFMNRYDRGSARLDRSSVWESPSGMKVRYRVNYTYNGGRGGWAELELRDGEFQCIRYHDFPNDCRSGPKY